MPRGLLPTLLIGIVTVCAVLLGLRWHSLLVQDEALREQSDPLLALADSEPHSGTEAAAASVGEARSVVTRTAPPENAQPASDSPPVRKVRVNINTANLAELEALPGIGPVLAQRIVDYRREHGPFTASSQLQAVSGIGPKKYAALKELVYVESRR